MYANAFVQGPAEMLDSIDFYAERHAGLDRAKELYLRGYEYLFSALERKLPGFGAAAVEDGTFEALLRKCKKEDVPLLYWAVAGGLSAYSIDVFDFDLGFMIPKWSAMLARAYELDPDFNKGAIDDLYILFYASLPENMGGDMARAEIHFGLALDKGGFMLAGPYVSYAAAVCAPDDYDAFKENLEKALAIDPDEDISARLLNILSQRKARYMLENAYEYFSFLPYGGWED
jgi:tetratricopeptide (TPR) repeat protein